jgi:hypothetical protein
LGKSGQGSLQYQTAKRGSLNSIEDASPEKFMKKKEAILKGSGGKKGYKPATLN